MAEGTFAETHCRSPGQRPQAPRANMNNQYGRIGHRAVLEIYTVAGAPVFHFAPSVTGASEAARSSRCLVLFLPWVTDRSICRSARNYFEFGVAPGVAPSPNSGGYARCRPYGYHRKRNRGVDDSSAPLLSLICCYLQPEQEAQQSAEEQQPACAAFAPPATPSAITAINNITFNVFIVFSFRSGKSCR
jgi:hypothetical protein